MEPELIKFTNKDEYWRLVRIRKIFFKRDGTAHLSLLFNKIHISSYESVSESGERKIDIEKLKEFGPGESIEKICSIEFARVFLVGDIWKGNVCVNRPDYMGIYTIAENFITNSTIVSSDIIDRNDLPNVSKENAINDIVTYKLNNLQKITKEDIILSFISFYRSEFYRYFFTGNGRGSINYDVIKCINQSTNNLYHELPKKKLEEVNFEENRVYLKNKTDEINLELIGNMIYHPKFKQQLTLLQKRILIGDSNSFFNLELPIEIFKSMKVCAKLVKKIKANPEEKDEWGLLVFQIKNCPGYSNRKYILLKDKLENQPGKNSNHKKIKKKKQKRKSGAETNYDNDISTNEYSDDVEFESSDFFNLMNKENDNEVDKVEYIRKVSKGKIRIRNIIGNNNGNSSGTTSSDSPNGDNNGTDITFEEIKFFDVFPKIIKLVIDDSRITYHSKKHLFLNNEMNFKDLEEICQFSYEDYNQVIDYYFIEFLIGGKYFYLFEKDENAVPGNDRTRFFHLENFNRLNETQIKLVIDNCFYHKTNEEYNNIPITDEHFFNHQIFRLTGESNEKEYMTTIEAVRHHANKITEKILTSFS